MAERSVILRLATKDGEVVKRALMTLGKEGEDALKRIERAGQPASRGIAAVDAAAKEARSSIENLASRAGAGERVLRAFGPAGLVAAAGLGALVIAFGTVMGKAREAVDYFDDLQDAAQRLGVSTEYLQAIRFAVGQSGGDIEKTEIALDRLNAVMGDIARGGGGEAAKAFKLLGVSATDAQGRVKGLERVLPELADGYEKLGSAQERASVATDLFGKGNQAFARVLAEGADGLERQIRLAREMGAVVDAELVRKGAEAKDKLAALSLVIKSQLYQAVIDAVPAIVQMSLAFAEVAKWAGMTADAWNALPNQRLETLADTLGILRERLGALNKAREEQVAAGGWFGAAADTSAIDKEIAATQARISEYEAVIEARNYGAFEGRRASAMASPEEVKDFSAAVSEAIDQLKIQEEQARRTGEELAVYNALLKVPGATAEERAAITQAAIETFRAEEAKRKAAEATAAAAREATKSQNEAERDRQRVMLEGQRVTASVETAEEKRARTLATIQRLLEANAIGEATAARARQKADEQYFADNTSPLAGIVQGLSQLVELTSDSAGQISNSLTGAFQAGEDAFVQFIKRGKVSFSDLIDSMIADLARLAYRSATNGLFQFALNAATAAFAPALPAGVGPGTNGLGFLTYGGPRAGGGDVDPRHYYEVNERGGREWFQPLVPGRVIPAMPIGGGEGASRSESAVTFAPSFTIDARGAEPGIETQIRAGIGQAVQMMKRDFAATLRDGRRRNLF
jgi:lambda family phage tail tape measure protein